MQILDPGHLYLLDQLDREPQSGDSALGLRFVKRVGKKFPGNELPAYAGTTTQEVLRALIDRTQYVNNQDPDWRNDTVIDKLRDCLWLLEQRAAERRNERVRFDKNVGEISMTILAMRGDEYAIEQIPTCKTCGHIACGAHS